MTKINVLNYGCSANLAESEGIKGLLKNEGYEISKNGDVIILNLCTVKGDESALREVRKAHEKNPNSKFVITGCVTNKLRDLLKNNFPNDSIMTTHQISQINKVVGKVVNGERVELTFSNREEKINLPKVRSNPCIGIILISQGCLSTCTYCSVKHIKGHLTSYSLQSIKKEVELCVKDGCKEIWLTSQDNGCWGFDIGLDPGDLLKMVCEIPGDFMVRFGMASPQHVLKNVEKIIDAYKHKKMFKFLHVPIQSGSDKVLIDMKREGSIKNFKEVVEQFKSKIPNIRISTDIIVGFPGESDNDFEKTVQMIENLKIDVVNISKFVSRPNTLAAKMKLLHTEIVKKRAQELSQQNKQLSTNLLKKFLGWKGKVIIDTKGKNNTLIARNESYIPIILEKGKIGDVISVEIVETRDFYCIGKIV